MKSFDSFKRKGLLLVAALSVLGYTTGSLFAAEFNWRKYEGTTIRVFAGKNAFAKVTKMQIKQFEKLTGIRVQAEFYPSAPLRRKLIMELGARNRDLDVFGGMMKTAWQYDKAGWLEPLDAYLNNPELTHPDYNFSDFPLRTRPYINGRLIGIAGSGNPQVLIYRKDLFQKYNIKVPTTWPELEAAAKKLKRNLKKGTFAWIARMNKENSAPFGPFLYSNGGRYLDDNRQPVFNSKEAVGAMEFYGRMAREYGPPGGSTIGWKEVVGAVAQGKAAMTAEIAIFAGLVWENPKRSKVAGKLGYALIPPGIPGNYKIMLPLNTWHISALSRKKEAAWHFVMFMTMKKQALTFKLLGLPTTRLSTWEHPAWKKKDILPGLSKLSINGMKNGRIGFEIQVARFTEARPIIERCLFTAYEQGDVQKKADESVLAIERLMKE